VRRKFTGFEDARGRRGILQGLQRTARSRFPRLDTNEEQRDPHLRSADFFEVDRYPEITFESTRVVSIDEESAHLYGNLTMHGITQR
jgi:hypothetical protein